MGLGGLAEKCFFVDILSVKKIKKHLKLKTGGNNVRVKEIVLIGALRLAKQANIYNKVK